MNEELKDDERRVEDDNRYIMASPGIMVASDYSALREYKKSVEMNQRKQDELSSIKSDVAELSNELSELKQLIIQMNSKLEDKN